MAEGACGYKSDPTWGIYPTPSDHSKCKLPFCVKSCVLSEFRISKEALYFDSNFGIKPNYENRPLCPEGAYFLCKEEESKHVCVTGPTWLLHITSEFIPIFTVVNNVTVVFCSPGLSWRWRTTAASHQSLSWKLGRNECYGQLATMETWAGICFWSDTRPVTHSQNTARKSRLNHHADSHTCAHAGTGTETTTQTHLMWALNKCLKAHTDAVETTLVGQLISFLLDQLKFGMPDSVCVCVCASCLLFPVPFQSSFPLLLLKSASIQLGGCSIAMGLTFHLNVMFECACV